MDERMEVRNEGTLKEGKQLRKIEKREKKKDENKTEESQAKEREGTTIDHGVKQSLFKRRTRPQTPG
jgi:hypothetical protein